MAALLSGLFATGQVKFTTVASSQEIGRGEYLQVEFVVENAKQIDQLNPPDFPGFHIAQGPIQSSGMSIVNGNMSQYKAVSYVLQPTKTGKFVIEGATAQVDGKNMRSNSVTITVNTSAGGSANSNGNGNANGNRNSPFMQPAWPDPSPAPADVDRDYVLRPGENVKEKIRKNLFLKIQVDKTSCYVGEPIVATYKLYSRLSSESRVTKRPSLNGFSVYDMVDPNSDAASVEKLNGKSFTVHIIRKTQLIPLQAGTIDLDPVEVENTVHFVQGNKQESRHSGNALKDLFDQLSDDNAMGPEVEENITLDTKPVSITVKPLPEEAKPVDYNGAVGSFGIQASLANRTVAAGEEATLNLIVKGKGNLPVINAPHVQWPAGMEAFDPTAKEDINKTTSPMSGSKTFSYVFTPGAAGHYTIPSVSFPYFDPATHSYKTVGTEPVEFQVTEAVKKERTKRPALVQPADAAGATGEIKKFVQQHLEWIFTILILAGLAGYLWRQNARLRRTEQQQKEKEEAEKKAAADRLAVQQAERAIGHAYFGPQPVSTAPVIVADPLLEARLLFEKNDYKGFYREVNRALWKALTRKLDLPTSELNKNNIARKLQAKGWDMETTLSLENVLNECEMNLYTPAYDAYNMQQLLKQAESMLEKLA